ncbi:GNAT family N-acetyltransferase [Kribbella capetownensis]|uniref:GNAT family N-acetyltransferase n=1 Tax=Kribbella capetownensis TaxID=1572659 RepID=A0A4R0K4Q7_9ACTN|nr:GNAT family N-acetyltransferase [Kribbella capetownensis]TCC53774.1 GNAT family N-acetyltransferase [Kribbella capetownensis]
MDVRVTTDPAAFQRTVFPFLQRDPVLHTLIMGSVHQRANGTAPAETGPSYFVSVHDGDVVGAAMRTPGRAVYLGALREDLAEPVADAYADVLPELVGVEGSRPAAEQFARRWSELRGGRTIESTASRLHKLGTLTLLAADAGQARLMRADELDVVGAWGADGFPRELRNGYKEWAARHLAQGTLWIWEAEGTPVSMAGFRLPTFGVCRIGPVYTPPEHRRHGYAGALTSHLSAEILAQGNQACLYTDLANPTSNKIYHQAGYRPVADFVHLELVA